MAMKIKIDFKQLLLRHGERIALITAGVITALLLFTGLLRPGHGLFSGSPTGKANQIDETTTWVEKRLNDPSNLPSTQHKPGEAKLIAYKADHVDARDYRLAVLIHPGTIDKLGRGMPTVFPIEEAAADMDRVNLRSYIFTNNDPPELIALVESKDDKPERGKIGQRPGLFGAGRQANLLALLRQRMGRGRPGGGIGGLPGQMPGQEEKHDKKTVPIPLNELDKNKDKTLAEQVRPLRVAVVAASFPYKKQIMEFRAKLGLDSDEKVFRENSKEKDKDGTALPSFRFLGVQVQRRELGPDGKPIGEFADLDLNGDYKPYIVLTGRRIEHDDEALAAVTFPGLVMPKLEQFPEENLKPDMPHPGTAPKPLTPPSGGAMGKAKDRYPPVEKQLKLLARTLEALKGKDPTETVATPAQFNTDELDIFSTSSLPPLGKDPRMDKGYPRKEDPRQRDPKKRKVEVPEYCLVRLVDVSVQPGKTYEYQMRIRMGNPNFARRDVANPAYAEPRELPTTWSKVPIVVHVKPDLHYYAVDQKELQDGRSAEDSKKLYRGPYSREVFNKDREVILQAHRWVDSVRMRGGNKLLIGEWSVAERFPVRRGEYVGREERVEIPYWRFAAEEFVVASDSSTTKRRPGIEVPFGFQAPNTNQPEAILIDFDSGSQAWERVIGQTEDKVDTKRVADTRTTEVLMLNPDGKLVLLEAANDIRDEQREKRLKAVRKRLYQLKNKFKSKGEKDPFGDD
jgi:hypothetical protein